MFSSGHSENAGRKKILRPCPKGCGKEYGARQMKAHIPLCDGPPATPPAPHPQVVPKHHTVYLELPHSGYFYPFAALGKNSQAVTPQREIAPKQEQGEDLGLGL